MAGAVVSVCTCVAVLGLAAAAVAASSTAMWQQPVFVSGGLRAHQKKTAFFFTGLSEFSFGRIFFKQKVILFKSFDTTEPLKGPDVARAAFASTALYIRFWFHVMTMTFVRRREGSATQRAWARPWPCKGYQRVLLGGPFFKDIYPFLGDVWSIFKVIYP